MKRGLIALDEQAVPSDLRDERLAAVRREMEAAGVDSLLIYVSVFRSDDLAYLTNLTIYWNEGVLVIPARGEPVFATKLSARTQNWMRAVSTLREIASGPDLAGNTLAAVESTEASRVGIADRDNWPAPLLAEIERVLPSGATVPVPDLLTAQRLVPDAAERSLLADVADLARRSVGAAAGVVRGGPDGALARLEHTARMAGATDVIGSVTHVAPGTACVHTLVQRAGVWAEHGVLAGDARDAPWAAGLDQAFSRMVAACRPGASLDDLERLARDELANDAPQTLEIRCTPHSSIGTRGDLGETTGWSAEGAVFSLALEALGSDGQAVVLADVFVMTDDGAAALVPADGETMRDG